MSKDLGLDQCHCSAFRRGARHIARLYDRHLAPQQIKSSQFTLLTAVSYNPGVQISDLAEIMVMERTTLVRALKPLIEAGWIESKKASTGRALSFDLTKEGRKKAADCFPLWKAAQVEFESTLGDKRAASIRDNNLVVCAAARAAT
ncbi:MarR family winged helix-turn-helix transcriptional regulator [Roseateles chitinivorans]|uniref:MarR family winged helix-turn-helix transcriptional regulator n=1 Tax=Roseateles chitinivorans TaxID=2917965 RepID=UPI003D67C42F